LLPEVQNLNTDDFTLPVAIDNGVKSSSVAYISLSEGDDQRIVRI